MTIYIKSPIIENNPVYTHAAVEARYLELTTARGDPETLIIDNLENDQGTHWMTGSSRLHIDDANTLVSEFPTLKIFTSWPSGGNWTPKE